MTHHRIRYRLTALTLAVSAGLALTACDPGEDPTPTPTTETSTEPTTTDPSTEATTVDYQQSQIDAAREFIIDSYANIASVGQDGFTDWEARIFPYYSGLSADSELWQAISGTYEQYEAAGVRIEGGTEIVTATATDWNEDPTGSGFDTVTFELCLDSTSVAYFNDDGTENTDYSSPDHGYPAEIEVMGQPDTDLGWSIMAQEADATATC